MINKGRILKYFDEEGVLLPEHDWKEVKSLLDEYQEALGYYYKNSIPHAKHEKQHLRDIKKALKK